MHMHDLSCALQWGITNFSLLMLKFITEVTHCSQTALDSFADLEDWDELMYNDDYPSHIIWMYAAFETTSTYL